ncbi:MAG: anthranilate phosphoribosyltransferase [Anaerolineae bacterium]
MEAIREAIGKVTQKADLSAEDSQAAMGDILSGRATPAQIGAFLAALRVKGETAEEILGCARAMRASAIPVRPRRDNLVDTCGTGGDMAGTFNISTIAALVVAGAGVPVAKHGNRSISSSCGSADLLEALGVNITLAPQQVARCIDEVGFGFLFAPKLHLAMANAMGPRRELGVRTIFNVLGPLTNPAFVPFQIVGVFDRALVEPLAAVMHGLGLRRALVVHGHGGLDELSTTGPNLVVEMNNWELRPGNIDGRDLGLARAEQKDFLGGDPATNAKTAKRILAGERGPKRDIVVLNAAAALYIADVASDLRQGREMAEQAIDSGAAQHTLDSLITLSNRLAEQAAA